MSTRKIGNDSLNQIFVKLDIARLEKIQKELGKKYVAEVGIMGGKANRLAKNPEESHKHYKARVRKHKEEVTAAEAAGLNNATIGLIHEKGSLTRNIPRRSFLEMPLKKKLPEVMGRIGNELVRGVSAANIEIVYRQLGVIAEGIVLRAFSTSGYGDWPANSPTTIARKKSSKPLIDTAQLRKSISNRVVTK